MAGIDTASCFSDYGARQALKVAFGLAPDPPPDRLYLALSSTPIQRDGSNLTEISGGGYTRALIPPFVGPVDISVSGTPIATLPVAGPGVIFHPSADIVFPVATSTWDLFEGGPFSYLYMGIYDAPTGGHLIWRLWEDEPGLRGPVDGTGHSVDPGFPTPTSHYTVGLATVNTGQRLSFSASLFQVGFADITEDGVASWPFLSGVGASALSDAFWVPVLKHMLGIAAFSPSWEVGLVHSATDTGPPVNLPPFIEPSDPGYFRRSIGGLAGPIGNRSDIPFTAPYVTGGGWSWVVGTGFSAGYRDCYPMLFDAAGNWAWLIGSQNTGTPGDGDTLTVPAASIAFQAF